MTNLAVSNVRNRPLGKASSLADLGLRKAKPDQLGNKVSRIHVDYYRPADIPVNRPTDIFLRQHYGMELGDRIRRARKLAEMNQTELGKRVGVKQSVISDLENGEIRETAYVVQIAMATG